MDGKHILIVDDDPEVVALLSAAMKSEGYDVQTAKDGIGAIVELQAAKYAAVLLDLMMPNFDGYRVVRYLRKHYPDVLRRVIIITGSEDDTDLGEVRSSAVFAVFFKPANITNLISAVRDCVAGMPPQPSNR